jgi:hypothetical protein
MRAICLSLTLASIACGGGSAATPAAEPAKASPTPVASTEPEPDSGRPRWIDRGSAAVSSPGGRAFYGVGSAEGIKNPAMLRSTAENRARAELAKVLEVFSASLMKDYATSAGEQATEQAVKTYASLAMSGAAIVDTYVAPDGSLYALAKLDLEMAAAAARAKEMGAATSHTSKVDVNDIFDRHAKKEAPPPAPKASAVADAGPAAPPPANAGAAAKSRKDRPAWVDGADPDFPYVKWLCAVGVGPDRTAAESAGYAALARTFVARVSSVSTDFMGAYAKTGAQSLEVQSTETLTKVSTGYVFSGVTIPEWWQGPDGVYALTCIERDKAGRKLAEQIADVDARAERHLKSAGSADKASRVRELAQALSAIVEREALNGELRIIDADGVGRPATLTHADVAAAFESAVEALKVGVQVSGPYDQDFRGALIDGLAQKGWKVSDGGADGMDVLVTATIRMEDGGAGSGRLADVRYARGVVQVEVKNVAAGKILGSFNESRKEGHKSKDEAERRAVRELAKKLVQQVGAKIENTMTR